jgi:FkbM family methyltransferase
MQQISQEDVDLFKRFEEDLKKVNIKKITKELPVYIFGAGAFGRSLAKVLKNHNFNILGFIDTNNKAASIDGVPLFSWAKLAELDLSAQLLIGVFNREVPFDSLKKIAVDAGFSNVYMPWDIFDELGKDLGWRYWLSEQKLLLENIANIKSTFSRLSDHASKVTLLNICRFRLGLSDEYASFRHDDQQYFNDLTSSYFSNKDECVYVDCGAYNGDTFLEALKTLPLKSAYLFEPDPVNYSQLLSAVKNLSVNSICLPLAVSETYQILTFAAGGEGGAIALNGSINIAAASLDQIINGGVVDFIKYDVEGAEIPALIGSRGLIEKCKPVLVMSLYHRPEDLWLIPAFVSSLSSSYKLYIRQHFYNSFDCVLYAIPS